MKRIVIFLVCVAVIAPVLFADKIVSTKRIPYSGKLVDCKDYTVSIKLNARRTIRKNLAEISQIVATDNTSLTKAEDAAKKKQYDQAATLYDQALKAAKPPWMKRLIEIRRFQALGKSGQIDKAVTEWIKRCDESQTAIGLAPTEFAPKSSKANNYSIDALEKKVKLLEKDLNKNKVYILALLKLKMKIQEANGNQDAVVFTTEQLDAVTNGKPRPTVSSTKASKEPETPAEQPVTEAPAPKDEPVDRPKVTGELKGLDALEALLKAGKADTVIEQIQTGLKNYGNKQLPQALLLLGKAQLQKFEAGGNTDKKLPVAAGLNFMRVYACFNKVQQAPEALYLAGVANSMIGDKNAARLAMKQLVKDYAEAEPENEFVVKAKKKLTDLKKTK